MIFPDLKGLLDLVYVILAIVAALVISPLWKGIKNLYKRMKDIVTVSERLKKLDDIHAQLLTNGGSTLRDSIDRIERKVAFNSEFIKHTEKVENRAVFHTNSSGDLEWANRAYLNIIDQDLIDVMDQGWVSYIAPEDRALVAKEWDAALIDERDFDMTFSLMDQVGKRTKVHCNAKIVKSKYKVFGYMGTITLSTQ